MSVPITTGGPQLQWSAPHRLFVMPALGASYDVAPGGEKFLVLTPTEDFKPNELTVLMNWQSGSLPKARRNSSDAAVSPPAKPALFWVGSV
jgi:hypothetical protein